MSNWKYLYIMKEKIGTLYLISNDINEKLYIGKTYKTLKQRWTLHVSDSKKDSKNRHLYNAMRKYGIEHFHIKEIGQYKAGELEEMEKYYIQKYDTYNNGYNCTPGGDGHPGVSKYNAEQEKFIIQCFYKYPNISFLSKVLKVDYKTLGRVLDKYITFSERPQLVDFSKCKSLHGKIQKALAHNEMANTNIEAVFDLILTTAINGNMTQEEIPQNILIVSDMEFDSCATCDNGADWYRSRPTQKLFDVIAKKYAAVGYKLPRLVFWNVNSRTGTIPVKENDLGVALVSGFSTNICKMVMSGETDPYKCLLETLNAPRYDAVEKALTT